MVPALLAFTASLLYGTADFMGGFATRRAGALATSVVSQSAGLLVIVVCASTLGWSHVATADALWGVAAGATGILGLLLLYRGLADGPMNVVAPTTALCALALPVLAGLAFGERPGGLALTGVAVAALAVFLVSRPRVASPAARRHVTRAVGVSIVSGTLIAAFLVCFERTAPEAGFWPLVAGRAASMVMVGLVITGRGWKGFRLPSDRRWLALPLMSGALDNIANVLYTTAVRADLLSVIAPVASLYPAATVLLARVVLGERLSITQGLGLASAGVAVALMAGSR